MEGNIDKLFVIDETAWLVGGLVGDLRYLGVYQRLIWSLLLGLSSLS